jgi:hypothetical protein
MPITALHTPAEGPDEPDRPVASTSEPYWRHEIWWTARYRDSTGALADLVWRCTALLLLRFTVDVADAGWPDDDFAVDVVPARTQRRLFATDARTHLLIRRTPTRTPRPQPRHRRQSNPG